MEQKTIEQIVESINALLRSQKVVGAEEWMDLAMDLQLLRYSQSADRQAKKFVSAGKLKEVRKDFKTKADAEIEHETTPEFIAYDNAMDLFDNLDRFERIARNESQIRKDNTH